MPRLPLASYLAITVPLLVLPRISHVDWLHAMSATAVVVASLVVLSRAASPRNRSRGAWGCIGLGMLSWSIGDCIWDWHELVAHDRLPFPSMADVFYLGAAPLIAAGLWRMGRAGGRSAYRFRVLDVAVICVGAGAAIWTLSTPGGDLSASHGLERLLLVAYPTADVVLVGMAAFALTSAARSAALLCLTLGIASLVVADVGFVHLVQVGAYSSAHAIASFWPLAFVLVGLGSLLPQGEAQRSEHMTDRRPHGLIALLLVTSLLAPASAAWAWSRGLDVNAPMLVVAATLMTTMVLTRLTLVTRDLERATADIRVVRDRLDRSSEVRGVLLERAARAVEDGRRNLAADLHDGPIQELAALMYGIEAALMAPDPDLEAIARQAIDGIGSEIRSLRDTMSWLRPPALDERGLEHAVADLGARLGEGTGASVDVHCELGRRLGVELEATVYRLVEEGLCNVARHAAAAHVLVEVHSDADAVRFSVVDDGRGFDATDIRSAHRRGSFGLTVMRERVEYAGGTWALETVPGAGVTVRASLPMDDVTGRVA